jgi:G6PDH family F420-dependent oxidoreductase
VVEIGYTMMGEQRGPRELVGDVVAAERAGFAFSVISDHYHPWLEAQGHAPYAWSVLGAAAQGTDRIGLMTYVTCPTVRYHPAVVAQKAATVSLLSEGRFRLGLGAGENLNEHVVGRGWPPAHVRHEMLVEAVEIIRSLWEGGYVNYRGAHFDVESARLFDLPSRPVPLGIAVSGRQSCTLAGESADLVIATEPKAELVEMYRAAGGTGPAVGQLGVCYGPDAGAALALAHEQFRWSAGGWKVMAELPNPVNFDACSAFVRPDDLAGKIPHGPDVDAYVEGVREFAAAGFDQVALVQIGPAQQEFCSWYERELGPALARL